MDGGILTDLELDQNSCSIVSSLRQLFLASKPRNIAQLSKRFPADIDACNAHLTKGKELPQVFVSCLDIDMRKNGCLGRKKGVGKKQVYRKQWQSHRTVHCKENLLRKKQAKIFLYDKNFFVWKIGEPLNNRKRISIRFALFEVDVSAVCLQSIVIGYLSLQELWSNEVIHSR